MTWGDDEPMTSTLVRCPTCGHAARVHVGVFDTRRFRCSKCNRPGRTIGKGEARDWVLFAKQPETPRPTASEFANWVFEWSVPALKVAPDGSESQRHRMRLGVITHREIDQFMRFKWTQDFLAGHPGSSWRVLFADGGADDHRTFLASKLTVEHLPVRCVPDLVLLNSATDTVLIIERKTTKVAEPYIPQEGWPNVEAQLWCYSHIDDWEDASEILLVGQLWRRSRGGIQLCHSHPSWKRSDPEHQARCRNWFLRYGGQVENTHCVDLAPSKPVKT
jgi:hypothetical protein